MGKTLLCSMLKELFAHGTQDFAGTYIYDDWPEDQCYPVISLSFSEIYSDNFELALKHALVAAFENVGMAQARSVALTLELSAFLQCLDDIAQDQPLVFLIDDWDIAHSRGLLRTTTETKAELLLTKPWTHCERFTSGQPPRTLPLYF